MSLNRFKVGHLFWEKKKLLRHLECVKLETSLFIELGPAFLKEGYRPTELNLTTRRALHSAFRTGFPYASLPEDRWVI